MKKWFTGLMLAVGALLLSGCMATARPLFFDGDYYMVGDASCAYVQKIGPTRAMCFDKHDNETGYRDALSSPQLQMYQTQQIAEQQNRAALNEQLRQTGQQWQAAGQQALQQSQSVYVPPVQGIPAPVGTTSYNQVGNTFIGTDGTSCQVIGQTTICR